jgi:phospholipid/cholesterol/gamma-HCH transport system substrate-binding protein
VSRPANHWKLGLFVALGALLLVAALVALGARGMREDTVAYVSYFDESVQGLEAGSPVKFRGVTVGSVSAINVAPDRRHVEVVSAVTKDDAARLGLEKGKVPDDMRVQLASVGITGVKFVLLDYFSPAAYPRPELPFAVPPNHLPAARSTLKGVEDALVQVADRVPQLVDGVHQLVGKVDALIGDADVKGLSERTAATLENADRTLTAVRGAVQQLEPARLSRETGETLRSLQRTAARVDGVLALAEGEGGLLSSAQRTSSAIGEAARGATSLSAELESTLRDIREAAEGVNRLTDALERDPDMLLKGRAKRGPK